jgi:hypothetical protein
MSSNLPREFRHLAELSAIAKISSFDESVRELIMQCIAVSPDTPIKNEEQLSEALEVFFNISLHPKVISDNLKYLKEGDFLRINLYGDLSLSEVEHDRRITAIENSRQIEEDTFTEWKKELQPVLSDDITFLKLEKCLRTYLNEAFRIHGIETAQILDNRNESDEDGAGLLKVLNSIISKEFKEEDRAFVRESIANFFNEAHKHPNRRKFILELADGVFSFYCFYIDPAVKEKLSDNLKKIEFFLDTNFLWGILGLHENQYVESSVQILKVSNDKSLPFKFRYHNITETELINSVSSAGDELKSKEWSQKISSAIKNNPCISGIEREFHQRNSEKKTDVNTFLKRFENISNSLERIGIIYDNRQYEWDELANEIYNDYKVYLERHSKEKREDAIHHDAKILALVQKLRSTNSSPLLAGTLFLTCDKTLYNFDVAYSRSRKRPPATIVPNVLLQILRPFLSDIEDFDSLFVKTFSIPEFRSFSKSASKAIHKMAEILAASEDLDPKIAEQLLLDDLLIREAAGIRDESKLKDLLEERLVSLSSAQHAQIQALKEKTSSFLEQNSRLEARHEEMQSDMEVLKSQISAIQSAQEESANSLEKATDVQKKLEREVSSFKLRNTLSWSCFSILFAWIASYLLHNYLFIQNDIGSLSSSLLFFLFVSFLGMGLSAIRFYHKTGFWLLGIALASLIALFGTQPF